MKGVASMALAEKQNEGLIFENCAGVTVNDIFPDDDTNEAFNKIDGNIEGVDWEVEPPEQEIQDTDIHIACINNNQYAALADDEDAEENKEEQENNTESIGVENNGESTGARHDNGITGMDRNDESTGIKSESGSKGATEKVDKMDLIEEAIAEADRDIAEGTELLAGAETETEDTQDQNVIHPDLQLPTEEHT